METHDIVAKRANVSGEFLFYGAPDGGNGRVFDIPDYQRPYVWKKEHCQALFSDIIDNEAGYFIGAIIIWGQNKPFQQYPTYEVVDGQQRLTTLSIFLAAIYEAINIRKKQLKEELGEESFSEFWEEDYRSDRFKQIQRSLTLKTSKGKLRARVMPHNEDNINDYLNIMIQTGLLTRNNVDYYPLKESADKRHRITKAYSCFNESIAEYANGEASQYKDDIAQQIIQIMELLKKVNSALVVMIEASSLSSANTLFESLNHRGEPLTITDLIKNKLFAALKEKVPTDYDKCRNAWETMIEQKLISPGGKEISAVEQERFFRHSYNACRTGWNKDYPKLLSEGKRANLYESYVKMIDLNPERVFNQITSCAKSYLVIQGLESKGGSSKSKLHKLHRLYKDLNRINGATSYTLLLHLVRNRKALELSDDDFEKIGQLLIKFFVRHSFTDIPLANKLDSIFIKFIDEIEEHSYTSAMIYKELSLWLKGAYRADDNDKIFISKLCGDVYERGSTNRAIKFVLIKLAENDLLEHEIKDIWDEWSIEHVLPQTVKPDKEYGKAWIEMLSGGVTAQALEIHKENVNKLGNLTLTPASYNAALSNRPFMEKRTGKKGYDKSILKSGLNSFICQTTIWCEEQIQTRTAALLKNITEIFAW